MNMADHTPVASPVLSALSHNELKTLSSIATARPHQPTAVSSIDALPLLLTPREAAAILRVTQKAIYMMIERAQLPGIIRIGRRVRIHRGELVDWLNQKSTPSPQEHGR